jgi:hypothetical protein
MTRAEFDAKLEELARLPPGWNTYDGKPTTEDALRRAQSIVDKDSDLPTHIIPAGDGGVTLGWGSWLDIDIEPDGWVTVFVDVALKR